MERILVTLDGSAAAESVLPYVATIAQGLKSEVVLLQVINRPIIGAFGEEPSDWAALKEVEEAAEKAARSYLEAKAEELQALGIESSVKVARGNPSDVILDYVESEQPGLVAMSTRGRSGIARVVLGSVATKVLQGSESPVLLIRPREDEPSPVATLTDVVVPLDASPLAEEVLPVVRDIASGLDLRVTLMMALPPESGLYIGPDFVNVPSNVMERAQEGARLYLEDVAQRLREEDGLIVHTEVLRGDPGDTIVEYARNLPNNLIAMSTHGRSGIGRWLLGSVTDKVVRASGDPVLVVRSTTKARASI